MSWEPKIHGSADDVNPHAKLIAKSKCGIMVQPRNVTTDRKAVTCGNCKDAYLREERAAEPEPEAPETPAPSEPAGSLN